jgi:tetratricopeptide (TPR) repeat protein
MALRQQRIRELHDGVRRALEGLGTSPDGNAFDGWLDPDGLARALGSSDDSLLLRVAAPLETGSDDYAGLPSDSLWLDVGHGVPALRWRSLRADGSAEGGATHEAEARAVELRKRELSCCDAAKCEQRKWLVEVIVDAGDATLIVLERVGDDLDALVTQASTVARGLAERLGVSLEGAAAADAEEAPTSESTDAALTPEQLSRWALRREGDLFVLRDHASRGPREAAGREFAIFVLLIVGTLATGAVVAGGWPWADAQHLAVWIVVGVVLALAALAAYKIARHSAAYVADSEALLYLSRDRMVVAPWVSRAGAVHAKPEGRYGAAVGLSEINDFRVERGSDGWELITETEHGPFLLGTLQTEALARAWFRALSRLMDDLAHRGTRKRTGGAATAGQAALVLMLACSLVGVFGCGEASWHAPTVPSIPPPPPVSSAAANEDASRFADEAAADEAAADQPPSAASASSADVPPKLRLIEDDVAAARAKAKTENKVLFVEVWAPWCHTCLSMKNFVLPDPAIRALADRVVFAAVDSDRPVNEAFMEAHEVNVWPTLFVLDPADESLLGMWQGAASVAELRGFLMGAADAREAGRDPGGALSLMLEAKRAHAKAKWPQAARHYRAALARGGAGWGRRSEALHGLLFAEYRQTHWERCATLGLEHVAAIDGAAVPTDYCWTLLSCADSLKNKPLQKRVRQQVAARLKRHSDSPPASASVDDRSDALSLYGRVLAKLGDERAAVGAVQRQLALLESAAREAPGPKQAATFDYARMNAYLTLGRGEQAVAMFRERIRQLPDAYEPHARLAQTYRALGRHAEALPLADKAIELSYGERRIGYLRMRVDLLAKLRRKAERTRALDVLIAAYDKLPAKQRNKRRHLKGRKRAVAERAKL